MCKQIKINEILYLFGVKFSLREHALFGSCQIFDVNVKRLFSRNGRIFFAKLSQITYIIKIMSCVNHHKSIGHRFADSRCKRMVN